MPMLGRLALLPIAATVLVGCGGSKDAAPMASSGTTQGSGATRAPDLRKAKDVRWDVRSGGDSETLYAPAADPEVQRVTLRNATRFRAILGGSSPSGLKQTVVPPGRTGSISWPRASGTYRLLTRVSFPQQPDLDRAASAPVG